MTLNGNGRQNVKRHTFLEIKRQLVSAPILAYPDMSKEFI